MTLRIHKRRQTKVRRHPSPIRVPLPKPSQPTTQRNKLARTSLQVEQHYVIEAKLYCEGKTQTQIADHLKIGVSTVSKDLAVIRKRWLDAMLDAFSELKARELARIDNLESEYWDAWKRSCSIKRRRKTAIVSGGTNPHTQQQAQEEDLIGDPRFLTGVMTCIERRIKLLGLDEPREQRILVGHVSATAEAQNPEAILNSEARRKELADLIHRANLAGVLMPGVDPAEVPGVIDVTVETAP